MPKNPSTTGSKLYFPWNTLLCINTISCPGLKKILQFHLFGNSTYICIQNLFSSRKSNWAITILARFILIYTKHIVNKARKFNRELTFFVSSRWFDYLTRTFWERRTSQYSLFKLPPNVSELAESPQVNLKFKIFTKISNNFNNQHWVYAKIGFPKRKII